MFKKIKTNKKGFTLAELLIVVAIIGVLVAISIPIFTTQLEKSREAVDLANARSAYAEVMAAAITGSADETTGVEMENGVYTKTIELEQKQNGWQGANNSISGIEYDAEVVGTPSGTDGKCTITCKIDATTEVPTISIKWE